MSVGRSVSVGLFQSQLNVDKIEKCVAKMSVQYQKKDYVSALVLNDKALKLLRAGIRADEQDLLLLIMLTHIRVRIYQEQGDLNAAKRNAVSLKTFLSYLPEDQKSKIELSYEEYCNTLLAPAFKPA